MSADTPRDPDGAALCVWCGGEIRQSGVGRRRAYCRRSCRQRAYEARRQREAVVAAVAAAVARRDSSRDEPSPGTGPSRDEMGPQVEVSDPRSAWTWRGGASLPEPLWGAGEGS